MATQGTPSNSPYIGLPMQATQPETKLTDVEVPLYIEPFIGWRCWHISTDENKVHLKSITYKMRWPHQKTMRAHCIHQWRLSGQDKQSENFRTRYGAHSSPNVKHGCGIYSVRERSLANRWNYGNNSEIIVLGEVKIWGKVLCFTEGFISEYAYPKSVSVPVDQFSKLHPNSKVQINPDELKHALEESYDVPVVLE